MGEVVTIAPPVGVDLVPCPGADAVLIGAGIGVTPIVSLAQHLPPEHIKAVIQVDRKAENAPFHSFFSAINTHNTYHFVPTAGKDRAATLENVMELACKVNSFDSTHFYVCGPNAFMDAVEAALKAKGGMNVHTERFGPTSEGAGIAPECPFKH